MIPVSFERKMLKEAVVMQLSLKGTDETIQLSRPVDLQGYGVGLVHLSGFLKNWNFKTQLLYLCSDVCQESFLNEAITPVVASISRGTGGGAVADVTNPVWLKIIRERITSIRLYVVDDKGRKVTFADSHLKCTLVFIPNFDNK